MDPIVEIIYVDPSNSTVHKLKVGDIILKVDRTIVSSDDHFVQLFKSRTKKYNITVKVKVNLPASSASSSSSSSSFSSSSSNPIQPLNIQTSETFDDKDPAPVGERIGDDGGPDSIKYCRVCGWEGHLTSRSTLCTMTSKDNKVFPIYCIYRLGLICIV